MVTWRPTSMLAVTRGGERNLPAGGVDQEIRRDRDTRRVGEDVVGAIPVFGEVLLGDRDREHLPGFEPLEGEGQAGAVRGGVMACVSPSHKRTIPEATPLLTPLR